MAFFLFLSYHLINTVGTRIFFLSNFIAVLLLGWLVTIGFLLF